MRISLNWLKDYVDITLAPEKLAEKLTMVGLEVESLEHLADKYKNFVVGEILEVATHPNADKLTVCKVDDGREVRQIVCGAPNVAKGQKVAVGLVGAIVPRSLHGPVSQSFRIERAEIRGIVSNGMICSAYELDLGEDRDGILVLDGKTRVGTALARYCGIYDTVFQIGITPNRPDCMSHVGVAREVAAITGQRLRLPSIHIIENREHAKDAAWVRIESPKECPRYSARIVRDVKIAPSPKWMQDRLTAVGLRPINNLVDITNYVLMELGHPLHAFDYDTLEGHGIVVKLAEEGAQFTTLDGVVRKLHHDTLLICDDARPIAIAGVMGGANTEITGATRNVLIESAYFDPRSIRRTSKFLGISTEASLRFERDTDPNITGRAADRAAQLIQELAQGKVLRGIIDKRARRFPPKRVTVRVEKVNEVLGTSLSSKEISSFGSKLELRPVASRKRRSNTLVFEVPTFRPDLEREIDIVEEVARLYGFDKIDTKMETRIHWSDRAPALSVEDEIREWLIGSGFREVIANSMQEKAFASLGTSDIVEVVNPISKEMGSMRTSLVPGMLEIIRHNLNRGARDLRLFEIGKVYFHKAKSKQPSLADYSEKSRLLIALCGSARPLHWSSEEQPVDVFDIKGEVEALLSKIFLDKFSFIYYSTSNTLANQVVGVEIHNTYAGYIGRVAKNISSIFDVKPDVFVAELDLDLIEVNVNRRRQYAAVPRYPSVSRDLAFIVDRSLPVQMVAEEIYFVGASLLQKLELFDVYMGENIPAGKKSFAFALEFSSPDRTLTEQEVDALVGRIVASLSSKFQATLRAN